MSFRHSTCSKLISESKRALIETKGSRGMRPVHAVFWYDECNEALKEWIEERHHFLRRRGIASDALFLAVHRDKGVARIGPSAVNIAF